MPEQPLSQQSQYLFPTAEQTEDAILRGSWDQSFQKAAHANFGFSTEPVWIRLAVANPSSRTVTWFLRFPYPLLDHVKVFYFDENRRLKSLESGDGISDPPHSPRGHGIAFGLMENPESRRTYYIRIQTGSSLQLGHFAYSQPSYERTTLQEALLYGLFFGSFLIMGIYNISIAFSTHSRQYLYYSLLVLVSVVREGYLAGVLYKYLWPHYPALNEAVGIFSMAISIHLANVFVMDFLNLKERSRLHYRILQWPSFLAIAYIALYPVVGYSIVIRPLSMQVLVNSILVLCVSVIHLKRGDHAVRFLTLAWVFVLAGWAFSAVAAYGLIPGSLLSRYANPLGQFFEIIFLSFALSDRINTLRQEKNQAIRALNKGLEREVRAKTQDIQSILDTIPLGILKLDGQGRLRKGHSRFLDRLLLSDGRPWEGQDLRDLLLSSSQLTTDEVAQTMTILASAVGENELQWAFNADLLPKELLTRGRIFELLWTPVLTEEHGTIQDILLVIKDITDLRSIEVAGERTRKENDIILKLIKVRAKEFSSFQSSSESCLAAIHRCCLAPQASRTQDDLDAVWRQLHTLKGVSRSLGFREISAKLHDAETCLQLLQNPDRLQELQDIVHTLTHEMDEYKRIQRDLLQRDSGQALEISAAELSQKMTGLESLLNEPSLAKADLRREIFLLKSLYLDPLSKIAHQQLQKLHRIAESLQKPLPSLIVEEDDYFFDDQTREVLDSVLMHLFRNSLDHGIETAAERLRQGKDSTGSIHLRLELKGDTLSIRYSDDGRGLNLEAIRSKAVKLGLIGIEEVLSPSEKAQLIFRSGFSTADSLSEISGRGVGMDAVRCALLDIGGSIRLELADCSRSFAFIMELPCHPRALAVAQACRP